MSVLGQKSVQRTLSFYSAVFYNHIIIDMKTQPCDGNFQMVQVMQWLPAIVRKVWLRHQYVPLTLCAFILCSQERTDYSMFKVMHCMLDMFIVSFYVYNLATYIASYTVYQ